MRDQPAKTTVTAIPVVIQMRRIRSQILLPRETAGAFVESFMARRLWRHHLSAARPIPHFDVILRLAK